MNDEVEDEDDVEAKRRELLSSVADARLTTAQTKVAWLLNHMPETRNSDITLQLNYWKTFCSDIYKGGAIDPDDLYRLPRLTSITRARASIQNTLGLYLADERIRKHRGTLSEDAVEEQAAARNVEHSFSVFMDESGKTGEYLIVGSCWLLDGIASRDITAEIDAWRIEAAFDNELHFANIGRGSVERYLEALEIIHRHAAALSFKSLALPRLGIANTDSAFHDLFTHMLVRGVHHEQESGRATLPRRLQVWKDAEEPARDKLLIANLKERLRQTSNAEFGNELLIGEMFAHD